MLTAATLDLTAAPIPCPFPVRRLNQAATGWIEGRAVAYDEARDAFIVDHGPRGRAAAYSCDVVAIRKARAASAGGAA